MVSILIGLGRVRAGGFQLFEKVMGVCIGTMFITVIVTAFLLWPGTPEILSGLFISVIPDAKGAGITWTVALIGGVGGTLTMLCYGYWIREKGRTGTEAIKLCKIELAVGYTSDRKMVDDSFDVGISLAFANTEDMNFYLDHPGHKKAVQKVLSPLVRKFVVYDFEG